MVGGRGYISEEHEHKGKSHAQSGKEGRDIQVGGVKVWTEKVKLAEGEVEIPKDRFGKIVQVRITAGDTVIEIPRSMRSDEED